MTKKKTLLADKLVASYLKLSKKEKQQLDTGNAIINMARKYGQEGA